MITTIPLAASAILVGSTMKNLYINALNSRREMEIQLTTVSQLPEDVDGSLAGVEVLLFSHSC